MRNSLMYIRAEITDTLEIELPALPGALQAQVTALQVHPGALEQLFPCCCHALHKQELPEPPCSEERHAVPSDTHWAV